MSNVIKFEDLIEEFEIQKEKICKNIQESLKERFKQFFDKHSDKVGALTWTQYTPYFNDGDECVFHMNELGYAMPGQEVHEAYADEQFPAYWKYTDEYEKTGETPDWIQELVDLEKSMYNAEEFLKDVFGDHVQVTVTKDGFEIEDYDHN